MGLFDKHKADRAADRAMVRSAFDAAEQLRHQAAAMQTPGIREAMKQARHFDPQAAMAYAQKAQRVMANGVDGVGTLTAVRNHGPGINGMSIRMEFDVNVTSGPGAPRSITIAQEMMGDLAGFQPGASVSVKINAQNPDEAIMLGPEMGPTVTPLSQVSAVPVPAGPPATGLPPTPGSEDDTIARLEQLAQLRDTGAISPEEFQQQKARILGTG
ncbi:MAG TPA: SHOCT domain-containing protein [Jatrophihabitantaceae bacterium]|jgi:hypothetical protein